jgi:hypothetical protein
MTPLAIAVVMAADATAPMEGALGRSALESGEADAAPFE